jgi:hypothetical protein
MSSANKIAHGVEVLAFVQSPQHRLPTRALQRLPRFGHRLRQGGHNRASISIGRLFRLFRRHVAEIELIDDVLQVDDVLRRLGGKRELVEAAVALLLFGAVAGDAVAAQEILG